MMKSIKKLLSGILTASLLSASFVIPTFAENDISVVLNGNAIGFDVPPQIINERTMVPLRAIFEALGASVDWDGDTRTVTSEKDGTTISLTIDDPTMYVNGDAVTLDSPGCIIDGRTLVPVRAISEAYGTEVGWDGDTKTVSITANTYQETGAYQKLANFIDEKGEDWSGRFKTIEEINGNKKISVTHHNIDEYIRFSVSDEPVDSISVKFTVYPDANKTEGEVVFYTGLDGDTHYIGTFDYDTHKFNLTQKYDHRINLDDNTINELIDTGINLLEKDFFGKYGLDMTLSDFNIEPSSSTINNGIFEETLLKNPCAALRDKIIKEGKYDAEKDEYSIEYTTDLTAAKVFNEMRTAIISYKPKKEFDIELFFVSGSLDPTDTNKIESIKITRNIRTPSANVEYFDNFGKRHFGVMFLIEKADLSFPEDDAFDEINAKLYSRINISKLNSCVQSMNLGLDLEDLGIYEPAVSTK